MPALLKRRSRRGVWERMVRAASLVLAREERSSLMGIMLGLRVGWAVWMEEIRGAALDGLRAQR